jgi:hypothetical protein
MSQAHRKTGPREPCEVIDFDEALLDACPAELRADLLAEARLLAGVFAPRAGPEGMQAMAAQLSAGVRDLGMSRAHARRIAAALKRLARPA